MEAGFTTWCQQISIIEYGISGTDIPSSTVISNAEVLSRWTWQANKVGATNIDTAAKTIMVSPLLGRHFGSQGWSNYALLILPRE